MNLADYCIDFEFIAISGAFPTKGNPPSCTRNIRLPIACRPVSARVERAKLFCIRGRLTAAHKSRGRLAIKVTIAGLKNRGDTVHLDVEAAIPRRNVDKDSSRRILLEVTPVELVNSRKHIY